MYPKAKLTTAVRRARWWQFKNKLFTCRIRNTSYRKAAITGDEAARSLALSLWALAFKLFLKKLLKLPTTHERKSRKSRYHECTSNALEVANSLLLVSSNKKIINFYQANTVLFVLRLERNHCYQRQICYPRSGQRKFRLRRAYPKDYYEESRI